MDVTPVLQLIGDFTEAGRAVAPPLAGLGFIGSALQLLIAHVMRSRMPSAKCASTSRAGPVERET